MKITYITYQGIPSFNTYAYGICTFSTIKYLVRNKHEVDLVFPLREKNATTELKVLQDFYEMYEDFQIKATKHLLPFGRIKFLEKYMYLFSHIVWSFYISQKHSNKKDITIFTLSDWVFYFLSKKNINVIYECHDLTKIRKKLVARAIKSQNSKIICINRYIMEDLFLREGQNVLVQENGYDEEIFKKSVKKEEKIKLIYSGNLQRFGKSRGVEEIIGYFLDSEHFNSSELHIFGGPEEHANNLRSNYKNENIFIHGHTKRTELAKVLASSHIGILTNVESDHSQRHTSPVKYYEYLGSGMNVVATNSLAHKELPIQNSIFYFDLDEKISFTKALNDAIENIDNNKSHDVHQLTLKYRMNKVIDFIKARPEGLEPSTP